MSLLPRRSGHRANALPLPRGEGCKEADGAVQMRARRALGELGKGLPWSSSHNSDLGASRRRQESEKDLSLW